MHWWGCGPEDFQQVVFISQTPIHYKSQFSCSEGLSFNIFKKNISIFLLPAFTPKTINRMLKKISQILWSYGLDQIEQTGPELKSGTCLNLPTTQLHYAYFETFKEGYK